VANLVKAWLMRVLGSESQVIVFERPLTIILGENGCGKTVSTATRSMLQSPNDSFA
jgi:predicted ATPase